MGIAHFQNVSSSPFRTSGLSLLLAPVQALASLFMPVRPAHVSYQMRSQLSRTRPSVVQPSLQVNCVPVQGAATTQPVVRLKVMREFEPGKKRCHAGRMVISGRMADVCAELDRIAQRETRLH